LTVQGLRSYTAPVTRLEHRGIRWELQPDFEPLLAVVLADPGRTIKDSPAKSVTVHDVGGRTFYLKRYRNRAFPFRSLKFFFKPSHARREWKLAGQIEARGVPIVRHLAVGERWTWRGLDESLLITEGFAGQPIHQFPARATDEVQGALGQFVRHMHDRGILQFDLFPNILVAGPPLTLKRVDVHHAVLKSALSLTERVDNLAFLHTEVPLTEKFFAAYGWGSDLTQQTRLRSEAMRRDYLAARARRCLRSNADFDRRRFGGLEWWVRLARLDPQVENILADPDAFLATRATLLKRGRSTTVGRGAGIVVKRFNLRKPLRLLKDLFRASRNRRAYQKAYHLELAGIPSARPIATAEKRFLRFLLRGYFVMEEIPGAVELGHWRGDSRVAARALAELLAKLHGEGFCHRDLKETNLVFDSAGRLHLIDLEGLEYVHEVSLRRAAADLARLARGAAKHPQFTEADRLRFLRRYCKLRGIRPRDLAG